MRFITKEIHAFLDYPVALALIGLPFLLGLGSSTVVGLHKAATENTNTVVTN